MDVQFLKNAAAGRWDQIIPATCGVSQDVFDGAHQACPKCGGKDRFRAFGDFADTGGTICNQCGRFADGLATIGWLTGQTFPQVVELACDFLGIEPKQQSRARKQSADPDENLVFQEWNEELVALWCLTKEPITPAAVRALGGQLATYRKQYQVLAFPVYGEFLTERKPVGRIIYSISGGTLPKFQKNRPVEWVKCKLTAGSQPGLLFNHAAIGNRSEWPQVSIKCEGPTDAMAAITLSPDFPIWTNANGCSEIPKHWMVELLADRCVGIIHDADQPGQAGVKVWASNLTKCQKIKTLALPYEIADTHGKDLRDWVRDNHTLADFHELFRSADLHQSSTQPAESRPVVAEHPDDPDRLARLNIERYRQETSGDLKYWRQQWYKWKRNRYQMIEPNELKAKVWQTIKTEFDRLWHEQGGDFSRKVTSRLVSNVIAAMESYCVVSGNVEMPCWLDGQVRERRNYISMKNGILDLGRLLENRDGDTIADVMRPHSPKWFSTFALDYEFKPDAQCPIWEAFLKKNLGGDQELIDLFQEWCGYVLSPRNDMQKFLAMEGDGSNGKSVVFAVVQAVLGKENCSFVGLENFSGRFALSETLGKQLNICADVGQIDSVSEGILKSFVSADPMSFDRKNKSPVSCSPTAKLMMAWNNRPRINDSSSGPWRRMLLIPFRVVIQEHEKVHGMDSIEFWQRSGELPGIFQWFIEGLYRLNQRGRFIVPESVKEEIEEYKAESNPVMIFLKENMVAEDDAVVATSAVYRRYQDWCTQSGHRPFSITVLTREIKRHFPATQKTREILDSVTMTRQRGFRNIRLA